MWNFIFKIGFNFFVILARWFLVVLAKDIFTHSIVESNIPQFALEKFWGGGGLFFFWSCLGFGLFYGFFQRIVLSFLYLYTPHIEVVHLPVLTWIIILLCVWW